MFEAIIIIFIVSITAILLGRSFYRSLTGKRSACGCSNSNASCCGDCRNYDLSVNKGAPPE